MGRGDETKRVGSFFTSLSLSASEIFGLFDLKARHGKGTKKIAPKPADATSDAA